MVSVEDYGEFETAWCPGCGNFALRKAVKQALAGLDLAPHQVCFVSGIGQAAKAPHYIRCNAFNGLHGRSLPPAQGAKLANPEMVVISESGDGCQYGEGGNHFLAAMRRNVDITMLTHDNQIYGLTKGQASPTTMQGHKTKAQPFGAPSTAFNAVAAAVSMGASFVARGFVGEQDHLADLIQQAINHKGFALVDIFQPCVSFNKVNTFAWYKEHTYKLEDHDPTDWNQAMQKAMEFGEQKIPIGVLYKNTERTPFSDHLPTTGGEPLARRKADKEALRKVMLSYGGEVVARTSS
ncbi:thiamine pyrophosphate-dependent enzyme [Desulfohalovibrio reitneri]|uniref:thiamine pyrophosphate-dependent enzyme n=1 Tax=Desulfohalovibrio reitneri TaxID=1307759 RepID=UPI0004A6BB4E|nr:thiamine pyrophosphate-dependent enzyme [Desulfohalovibrio reitneri]